jgi:hypothetical protein
LSRCKTATDHNHEATRFTKDFHAEGRGRIFGRREALRCRAATSSPPSQRSALGVIFLVFLETLVVQAVGTLAE